MLRWPSRVFAVGAWMLWFWRHQVGCGVWAGACLPPNPLEWPVNELWTLFILPAVAVCGVFYITYGFRR